ncbi:hypothetical protein LCGC14_0434490 [marine sediment metagenome]|uniref:Uncharacterized protein n=1 Tax=marine sediment metagenome TaxID=412755 RepID=A0A0F9STJ7_9ZZZZ
MATDKLQIYNFTLTRLGANRLDSITEDSDDRRKLDTMYPQILEELTAQGPQQGWKFATTRTAVDVSETDITAFADYSETVSGTVSCTAAGHNLDSGERANLSGDTGYDDDYVVTVIDDNTFYFTATWSATGTGTVRWTSLQYAYRYSMPTNLKLVSVQVGGFELSDWVREDDYVLTNLEDTTVDMKYVVSVTTTTRFPPYFTKVLYLSLALELAYSIIQSATFLERLINEVERIQLPRAIARDEKEQYVQESSSSWQDAARTGIIE